MKLNAKLATLAGALLLSSVTFAKELPSQCPDVNAIKAEGLSAVELITDNYYFAYQQSNYNTETDWIFLIGIIEGDDEGQVLEDANNLLTGLSGNPSPEEEDDVVGCLYDLDDEHMAIAVTGDSMLSPRQARRFFRK